MKAHSIIRRITDSEDDQGVCLTVLLRAGDEEIEVLTQKNNSGDWGLPGGHQKNGETPEEAAARELKEETGVKTTVEFLANVKHHKRREQPAKVFYAVVDSRTKAEAGSDAKKVKWRPVDQLDKLCADDRQVIKRAVKLIHDPEAIVQEAIELNRFPVQNLVKPIANRGDRGILIAVKGAPTCEAVRTLAQYCAANKLPHYILSPKLSLIAESSLSNAHRLKKLTPLTDALIRAADALSTWEREIKPRLDEGKLVICAPWLTQTLAECGNLEKDLGEAMFRWAPTPDVVMEADDLDPEAYFKRFVDKNLGATFLIHQSGEHSVYADEPFRFDWIVYSDDQEMPEDWNQDDPEWKPGSTRSLEGYLKPTEGKWQAFPAPECKRTRSLKRRLATALPEMYTTQEQAAYALYLHNRRGPTA